MCEGRLSVSAYMRQFRQTQKNSKLDSKPGDVPLFSRMPPARSDPAKGSRVIKLQITQSSLLFHFWHWYPPDKSELLICVLLRNLRNYHFRQVSMFLWQMCTQKHRNILSICCRYGMYGICTVERSDMWPSWHRLIIIIIFTPNTSFCAFHTSSTAFSLHGVVGRGSWNLPLLPLGERWVAPWMSHQLRSR